MSYPGIPVPCTNIQMIQRCRAQKKPAHRALLSRHKLENERQSDGRGACASAWSLHGSSCTRASIGSELSVRSEDVKLPSSAPLLDANDPKGKQELERREVRDTGAGPAPATGDATMARGAGDMGELAGCA